MDGTVVYANLFLTFGLGMLVAAVTARLTAARRALECVVKDVPTEDNVVRYIEGIVERDLPTALHNAFEDRQRRLAELREEVRRNCKREALDALESTEFQQLLERMIQDKLTRGAFANSVKVQLEEQYKAMRSHIVTDLLPRAVEKGLTDTGRIVVASAKNRIEA
jgi:hypothetical protein